MNYHTPYTIPTHWKSLIDHSKENRNGRKYVKGSLPGKSKSLSVPLWIILRRLWAEKSTDYPSSKDVKKMKFQVKINGKIPKDERCLVMIFDHLTIGQTLYRFELIKFNPKSKITYRLVETKSVQKIIVNEDRFKGDRRINFLNGERQNISNDQAIKPGSIWTEEKILMPENIKKVVRLTGKNKFLQKEVKKIQVKEDKIELEILTEDSKTEKIVVDWQALSKRTIGLIA